MVQYIPVHYVAVGEQFYTHTFCMWVTWKCG